MDGVEGVASPRASSGARWEMFVTRCRIPVACLLAVGTHDGLDAFRVIETMYPLCVDTYV
jgi:hypothetical protein